MRRIARNASFWKNEEMSVGMKNVFEMAARGLMALLVALLCWIGKDAVLQLRQIQADLVGIKVKLAVMESSMMTPDTVRQLIQVELLKYEGRHKE